MEVFTRYSSDRCNIGEFSGKQLEISISSMFIYKGMQEGW